MERAILMFLFLLGCILEPVDFNGFSLSRDPVRGVEVPVVNKLGHCPLQILHRKLYRIHTQLVPR